MRASHFVVGLALALYAPAAASAQAGGCTLTPSRAPEIRGLRLGMSAAQLRALYPRLPVLRADEFGQAYGVVGGLGDVDEVAFKGVDSIRLNFIDDRLVAYQVNYPQAPWDSLDQFIEKLNESLRLPGGWADAGPKHKRLACVGLQIDVGASGWSADFLTPYVSVVEFGAEAVVKKRVAEKRERQRREFKP